MPEARRYFCITNKSGYAPKINLAISNEIFVLDLTFVLSMTLTILISPQHSTSL